MSPSAGGIRIRLLAFKVLELDFTKVLNNSKAIINDEQQSEQTINRWAVSVEDQIPKKLPGGQQQITTLHHEVELFNVFLSCDYEEKILTKSLYENRWRRTMKLSARKMIEAWQEDAERDRMGLHKPAGNLWGMALGWSDEMIEALNRHDQEKEDFEDATGMYANRFIKDHLNEVKKLLSQCNVSNKLPHRPLT